MKRKDDRKVSINWLEKAREHWNNTGKERPPFAIEPKKGQRSVWDFPRPPIIEKIDKQITVNCQGKKIVDSHNSLAVLETASPPTYYIPKSDIEINKLVKILGKTSLCEWKGNAIYWTLKALIDQPIAWSYPNPFSEFSALKDHIAFYPQHLECYIDGKQVEAQASKFYAGWITPDLVGPFKGEMGTEHW
ncbi:DUF427 domain-containing protein [Aquimarina sp. BL5]|uniref:DUF427 domain-containing protein n=1 Tax=Aquimarina sp. BL5 TaxID=1714860 RepID=UPI000E49318F|nr:DUF427 domain-containing protein [Aquimarina sp. BL5]AXT51292.1 DUF427 domain-containing protein [Aquimarina sp. BL5]RKN09503.1 DUF427 domain-containing protein [Aquimarina sp. BL5]